MSTQIKDYQIIIAILAICFSSGNAIQAEVPNNGLIGLYLFNGNANDGSGNGNHGTVFGAALTTDRFGSPDKAYRFDGINDYIQAHADNLPTSERTISLWFRADQINNRPGLIGYGGGNCGTSWLIGINNGGANKQYQMQGHCLANRIRGGYGPIPIGRWHHWLITTDAAGTKMFIDGIEHERNTHFVTNTSTAGKDLSLGVITSPGGVAPFTDVNIGYFDGMIDDVAIYSRALEASEIQDVFDGNLPQDYILYYPFDGSASDQSGNGNDGFVVGPTLTEDRFGNPQSAYNFDGINDYIRASADGLPTGERTVSLWFFANSLSNRPGILGYGGGTCGTSWLMGINNGTGDNQYQLQGHCLSNLLRAGYGPKPVLEWKHLIVMTNSTGTRILVDGAEVASNSNFVTNTNVAGRDLSFGTIPSPSGFSPYVDQNIGYFDGKLDDIAIYNRALHSDDIRNLLNDGDPSIIFINGFEAGSLTDWPTHNP